MRTFGGLVFLAALLAAPGAARAESAFDELASEAVRVDRDGLAGILWAMSADCSDGDDLTRRQCRTIRDTVLRRYEGRTLIVPGDSSAFQVAEFDAKKKATPVTLTGCIACVEPIVVDGVELYVLSDKGAAGWSGAVAKGAAIHTASKTHKSEAAATKWKTSVATRFKTDFLVSLPKTPKVWKDDGKSGISLSVLGFRVVDPCDGGVICASPKAAKVAPDKKACGEAVVEGTPDGEEQPKKEEVPEELSAAMIKKAMAPVREVAAKCFEKYGVAGDAKVHVTVASDGSVTAVEQSGDFVDTPTGECLDKAVQAITFPETKKAKQSFKYPIILR